MMKNTFYFMLRAIFVHEIHTFLYQLFDYIKKKKTLIIKLKLISKFMTSQTKQQMNTIYSLPNISKIKATTQCNLAS